jgi:hypothetical protein
VSSDVLERPVILEHSHALAVYPGFQSVQALKERDFNVGRHFPKVGIAAKKVNASCSWNGFAAYFVTGVIFQALQHGGQGHVWHVFIKSADAVEIE